MGVPVPAEPTQDVATQVSGPLAQDLASYPGLPPVDNVGWMAERVGALVAEAWAEPVTPVPEWVRNIALQTAVRVITNPKGLASWTRAVDDASRTERLSEGAPIEAGIRLTDGDRALLGLTSDRPRRRVGSIPMRVPGWPAC